MTINEFVEEFDNLTEDRRKDFLRRLFGELIENLDNQNIEYFIIDELLPVFALAEDDDLFGTEGFRG